MKRPAFGLVIVGWLCAAGAAFLALFGHGSTDDYAGWVPATVVLQVPAFFAFRGGTGKGGEEPLSVGRRWALIVPAAIAAAVGAFWAAGAIGVLIWEPTLAEFRPLLMAMVAGMAALIGGALGFARVLQRAPHRRGVRRVLLAVTAIGAAGIGAPVLLFSRARGLDEPAVWLAIGAPVLWAMPLWMLIAVEPPPEPPIPRVVVR